MHSVTMNAVTDNASSSLLQQSMRLRNQQLQAIELNADGTTEISMLYSNYQLVDSVMLPKTVILSVPTKEITMKIEAQEYILNSITSKTMRFRIPSSMQIMKME